MFIIVMMASIQLPNIVCSYQNHRGMRIEYVCMHDLCQENNHSLACLYCCQEYHQDHINDVIAIKVILSQMVGEKTNKGYNILGILLKGIQTCSTFKELQTNFAQVIAYRNNPQRVQSLVDEEMQTLQKKAEQFYQRSHKQKTVSEVNRKSSQLVKESITPILSLKECTNCTQNSPFSMTLNKNQLTTVFALPSLSKFHDSIDITLKVERYTPSWLAVGVSIGQNKYQQNSNKHLLAISNGWLANRGVLEKSKLKFGAGDEIRLRWDKNMQLLEFITSKKERLALKLENKWSEQIYLCVCLFYAGDSVRILA